MKRNKKAGIEKILILAYYWPPGGGAGVQRWLKLSKYMAIQGVEVHVITVDPAYASYMQTDKSLCDDVHERINVYLTKSFEPLKYYAKIVGKSKVPVAGFSNVNQDSWTQKCINSIRSHLFIPDPRRGWNRFACRKALEVIRQHDIKHVITTSPPHSTQLTGLKLKKKLGGAIKWIADLRDPWTDIYYYKLLRHSLLSHKIDKAYEKKVIERADILLTVGDLFKASYLSKSSLIDEGKIVVIPNGYDDADFKAVGKDIRHYSDFTITYTGTLSDYYQPQVFFRALARLISTYPDVPIRFKLVGVVSQKIRSFITDQIGSAAAFIPTVTHHEAIRYMLQSHCLLLVTQGDKGTIPGKTFEYLASQNRILSIGSGDAGSVIAACKAGKSFERSEEEAIFLYLETALNDYIAQKPFVMDKAELVKYSRSYQAAQVLEHCI